MYAVERNVAAAEQAADAASFDHLNELLSFYPRSVMRGIGEDVPASASVPRDAVWSDVHNAYVRLRNGRLERI